MTEAGQHVSVTTVLTRLVSFLCLYWRRLLFGHTCHSCTSASSIRRNGCRSEINPPDLVNLSAGYLDAFSHKARHIALSW